MFAGFSVGNIVRMDRCAVHIFRQLAQTASYMMPVIPAMALLTGNFYESGRKINTQPGLCTVDIRNVAALTAAAGSVYIFDPNTHPLANDTVALLTAGCLVGWLLHFENPC